MMRWIILSLALLMLALSTSAQEQQDEDYWYFALDQDNERFVAFNKAGTINDLGDFSGIEGVFRVDHERILFLSPTDDGYDLVMLTPTDMRTLTTGITESLVPIAFADPYLIMIPVRPTPFVLTALLINLDTGETVELLTPSTSESRPCCVFSADGSTLYYIAAITDEPNLASDGYEIRERDLQSGDERVVYEKERGDSTMTWLGVPQQDRWLLRLTERGEQTHVTYQFVDLTGEIEAVGDYTVGDEGITDYRVFQDQLIAWQIQCESDCTLRLTDLETDEEGVFLRGDSVDFPRPIYVDENAFVTLGNDNTFVRLTTDNDPQILGTSDPRVMTGDFTSPDGRFAFMSIEDPLSVLIWDNAANEPIYVVQPEENAFIGVTSANGYMIMRVFTPKELAVSLNLETGVVTEWETPEGERTSINTVISDTQALFFSGDESREMGIYLNDQGSGDFTLLVPGVSQLIEGIRIEDVIARRGLL